MTRKDFIEEIIKDSIVFTLSMVAMYVSLAFESIGLNNQLTLFFFGIFATGISLKRMVFSVICVVFAVEEYPIYKNKE